MATRDMTTEARALAGTMPERPVALRARSRGRPPSSALEEFEQVYVRNIDVLAGYFARRCRDPQTVADLTSDTFIRAVYGFATFDPGRGSDRAWLFGIAARVFAHHCEQSVARGVSRVALRKRLSRPHPRHGRRRAQVRAALEVAPRINAPAPRASVGRRSALTASPRSSSDGQGRRESRCGSELRPTER